MQVVRPGGGRALLVRSATGASIVRRVLMGLAQPRASRVVPSLVAVVQVVVDGRQVIQQAMGLLVRWNPSARSVAVPQTLEAPSHLATIKIVKMLAQSVPPTPRMRYIR